MGPYSLSILAVGRRLFLAGVLATVVAVSYAGSTSAHDPSIPDITGTWVSTEGVEIYGRLPELDGIDASTSETFTVTSQHGAVFRATVNFVHNPNATGDDPNAQIDEAESVELQVVGVIDYSNDSFMGGTEHNLRIYGQLLDEDTMQIVMFASGGSLSAGRHTFVREGS